MRWVRALRGRRRRIRDPAVHHVVEHVNDPLANLDRQQCFDRSIVGMRERLKVDWARSLGSGG
jgi:hypothetical protein